MDEYSILRKKRKKNGFAATSLLISIALALLVLVGAVLILGKVDNKNLTTPNDDSNITLGSSAETTCVGLNKEMLFNYNINVIKEAAISYFTNERLPQNVGETVKLTLKEMKDKKIILNVIDSSYKLCADDKSYVEVTKEDNEYVMKIFLSCSDMEDYILVHLGCYDYCDSDVCEKKEEKQYEYEYKKTTNCVMTDWSNWGAWKTTREKTSNLKKEDIKVETTTKDVIDTKDATKTVTYNCDKYPGYTLVGDKCIKTTSTKDIKDATVSKYSYNCDKYPGYTLSGTKCIKTTTITEVTDATKKTSCPSGYTLNGSKCERTVSKTEIKDGSYVCASGYTLSGTKCIKTTTSTSTLAATAVYATKTVKENYTCYQNQCTTKTVFTCPTGQSCGNYPQTSCEKVKKTCTRDKQESYISGYSCPSGYTLNGTTCSKTVTNVDTKDATFTCPSGYSINNNKCVKSYQEKESIAATITYTCSKDATLKDKKCYKDVTTTDTKTATKVPSAYTCPSGYTLNDTKCIKESTVVDKKDATSKTNYTCPTGYTKNDKTCTKKTTEIIKTTYYRYATRSCNGGSVSIKWSTSKNDSILISDGYKLTGNKRVLIVK